MCGYHLSGRPFPHAWQQHWKSRTVVSLFCCRHPRDSSVWRVWVLLTVTVGFGEEYWRWPDEQSGYFVRADGTDWHSLAWDRDTECGVMTEANKIMECGTMAINWCLFPAWRLKSPLSLCFLVSLQFLPSTPSSLSAGSSSFSPNKQAALWWCWSSPTAVSISSWLNY